MLEIKPLDHPACSVVTALTALLAPSTILRTIWC